jgi:hypothetical protein
VAALALALLLLWRAIEAGERPRPVAEPELAGVE